MLIESRNFILAVAVLAVAACGLGPDPDAVSEESGDSVPATAAGPVSPSSGGPVPDSAVLDSEAQDSASEGVQIDSVDVLPPGATGPPLVGSAAGEVQEPLTVDQRIEALLAAQEGLSDRIDSLTVALATADATGPEDVAGAGEVLGEAREQVRSFGLGVAMSIVVVLLFNLLIRMLTWVLDTLSERSAKRRLFYKRLVPIVRIVLWVFAAYLIVRVIFRVDAQGLLAATAAIGVAVGFAAQDLLKNLFGGLILVFDQPFQVGDKISVGGTYGEVVSIGLRSTRIVTSDDNRVSVPNAQVVDQQVANANAGELNCQVVTDLYLPGWVDEARAKKIAFEAAASSKYVYLNKPIVVLVKDEFKETFLTRVRVKAYVLDPRFEFLFESDVTERARSGFREAGLLSPEHSLRTYMPLSDTGSAEPVPRASDGHVEA